MNTLRNELKRSYSQIPNELITDLTLSAGALRVLLYLFTKPDDWNVYNKDICKQLNINEKTLTRYWKQLLESQWLRRDKEQDKHGKFVSGGFLYRIGNFTVSDKIPESDILSESDKSNEHSNTKPITKNKLNTNTKLISDKFNLDYISKTQNIDVEYLENFISYRKDIKKPIKTKAPVSLFAKELDAIRTYGVRIEDAINMMHNHEWQTIKLEWVKKSMPQKSNLDLSDKKYEGGSF